MNSLNEDLQLKSRNFSTLLIQFKGLFSIVAGASKTKRKDHEEESERRVLKNIRVIVFCDEHIVYSSQLYRCRLDDSVVPDFKHLLSDTDDVEDTSKPPSFEHEWTTNEKGILFPEMAAICVVTTDLVPFIDHSAYEYQFFVHYDVTDSDDHAHNLQLYCGNVTVTTAILFEPCYQAIFNQANYLLTVTATSKLQLLDLRFVNNSIAESCYVDFIVDQMKFTDVSKINNDNQQQVIDFDMLDLTLSHTMMEPSEKLPPCDVYYQANDGYFKGTLIRRQKVNSDHHKLKIYNASDAKISSFLRTLSSSFGRFITITSADPKCAAVKFGDLQQALQAEVDLLVGYDYDVVTGTEELEKFQMQRLLCERETDRCYLNLKQKTKAMRPQEI